MKKTFFAGLLAAVLLLCGCGGVSADQIAGVIKDNYEEESGGRSIVYSPVSMDAETFCGLIGADAGLVKDFSGQRSSDPEYNDMLAVIEASDGEAAKTLLTAVKDYRTALTAEWRDNPINGNYQRAKDAMAYSRYGKYVFFFCLGAMPEDTDEELDFSVENGSAYYSAENFLKVK